MEYYCINNILLLEKYFFKISKNSIASAFFFLPRQILKNIDMPWQKPWHLPTAKANFERCTGVAWYKIRWVGSDEKSQNHMSAC